MTKFKVQKRIALRGKLDSGVRVGQVWKTIASNRRKAVAESIAWRASIDHDDAVRVVQQ